ncbi:MAG: AzlC family ABC transporter permease [Kibdelosporangium sp.]
MRSLWKTLGPDLARDIALVCVADAIVGLSFGAITVGAGLPVWLPMLLSVVVFAGAAQFTVVAVLAAGGDPIAAVAAALLVNTRLIPLGFTVGDLLGPGLPRRMLGAHLVIDENVAFTLGRTGPQRRAAFWACGSLLFACWNLGVLLGAFGGTFITDTNALGLDAAFPAVMLALVLPALNDGPTRRAALAGVVIALATAPFVSAGLPLLFALVGVVASLGGDRITKHGTTKQGATKQGAARVVSE